MNTRQFEYILALAELKNFGLAAEKCFITQSTLSTMVAKFESEAGVRIFDRKTKPVTVTREGNVIIDRLKLIHKEIKSLDDLVKTIKGDISGELKIGVIPTVAPFLLPEFLNDFAKKFPKMNFKVSEMTTEVIEALLEKRELDIGILALPIANSNLVEIPVYNEPFVLYDCSENVKKDTINMENIDYSRFWLLEEGHCLSTQVSAICDLENKKGITAANFDFKAGSIESLVRFVKMNNGITLLPYLACLDFLPEDSKKLSYFKNTVPARSIGLLVHRHFSKRELLEALKDDIHTKIQPLIEFLDDPLIISPKDIS